jgi:HK97 family phage major capsid protein
MNLNEMRARILELSEKTDITEEEIVELDELIPRFETEQAEAEARSVRAARIEKVKAAVTERTAGYDAPQIMRRTEVAVDVRSASNMELRDAALALLDSDGKDLSVRQGDHLEKLLRTRNGNTDGTQIAKRMLLTENDHYRSAFAKAVTSGAPAWTAEEARAISEFRAMSGGVDTAGGFGVPVLIDPSIILTSGAAAAPVLQLARIVTITTDEWKGVSSAGVSWSYDNEAAQVSDDAPTLAQPSVPVRTARGFIPYSIEIGEDYPSFAAEMRRLLDAGYIDLVAQATITGDGNAPNPTGVFTAIAAVTNSRVATTTTAQFGAVDLLKVWKALPERYRGRATWLMSTGVENEIRNMSATANGTYYTINLTEGGLGNLFGRPVRTTDYAPDFTATTGAANLLVVGDFENFLVAQRAGMSIEFIPHLFGANQRPTGERGWFAYARHGFNSVNSAGFRILQNKV